MVTLRFLPQTTLDAWVEAGKADPSADKVVDLATRAEYPIREALRFVRVESGADAQQLLHKVKTLDDVRAMGAEHYMNSVILGETVYEVVPGWIAQDPSSAAGAGRSKGFEGKNAEADMLAKLLLDKLS